MNAIPAHKNQQGLSLLEVLLAIALASMGITVLITLSNNAITGSGDARSRSVADQYVREGIDLVRSYRDTYGFNGLLTKMGYGSPPGAKKCGTIALAGTPLAPSITTTSDTTVIQNGTYKLGSTSYYRIVCFTYTTANELNVEVTVAFKFKTSTPTETATASTILSNWR